MVINKTLFLFSKLEKGLNFFSLHKYVLKMDGKAVQQKNCSQVKKPKHKFVGLIS